VLHYQHGDRKAWEELIELYEKRLFYYIKQIVVNEADALNLLQDTWLRVLRTINRINEPAYLTLWLYRIAINVSRRYWRRHKGNKARSIEGIEVPEHNEAEYNKIGDYEQVGRLKTAVEQLPMRLKQAVVLHYMQHLSIGEAAEAAGVREGTFKSRLNRALNVLRKQVPE